ncbi:MAG: hypothetical protein Q9168_005066 [Polycauliona sp. 1 TL-2023]
MVSYAVLQPSTYRLNTIPAKRKLMLAECLSKEGFATVEILYKPLSVIATDCLTNIKNLRELQKEISEKTKALPDFIELLTTRRFENQEIAEATMPMLCKVSDGLWCLQSDLSDIWHKAYIQECLLHRRGGV